VAGGLIIGGLIGAGISKLNLDWRLQLGVVLVPAVIFGSMVAHQQIPAHRAGGRRGFDGRNDEGILSPIFPGVVLFHVPHRGSELRQVNGCNSRLTRTVHMPGILLLVM